MDPVGGTIGDSQSWNRFAYVRNRPLILTDPNGMDTADFIIRTPMNINMKMYWTMVDFMERLRNAGDTAQDTARGVLVGVAGEVVAGVPTDDGTRRTVAFEFGKQLGDMLGDTPILVEQAVSGDTFIGPSITVGYASVNGSDSYLVFGIGAEASLSPMSYSYSIGAVDNYCGRGSLAGHSQSIAWGGPIATEYSGNYMTTGPVPGAVQPNPLFVLSPQVRSVKIENDIVLIDYTETIYIPLP